MVGAAQGGPRGGGCCGHTGCCLTPIPRTPCPPSRPAGREGFPCNPPALPLSLSFRAHAQEAEDQHFAMEEQVTAVAARDDVADDLLENVRFTMLVLCIYCRIPLEGMGKTLGGRPAGERAFYNACLKQFLLHSV